ncbi:MAG: phosphate acyltransferase [Opitutales bacterium]
MALIDRLAEKLQRHPKRVVFPEGSDPRILQAARSFATRRLGVPILLGDRAEIKDRAERLDLRMDGIRILEPERSEDLDLFLPMIQDLPRFSQFDVDSNRARLLQKNYFAAMMLMTGRADALVSGATTQASSALRPIFQTVPLQEHVRSASSMLVLDLDNTKLGVDGALFLADCGVIPEPDQEQLADIAVTTADIAGHLTGAVPRVALLSWATKAQRDTLPPGLARVREAVKLARAKAALKGIRAEIDGEMQVDAALVPEVALVKGVEASCVGGQANVLVFPDLNCGNIVSKMVLIVSGARGYGQVLTGLTKPCAEISRGAHAYDILGTSIIVAAQAIDRHFLYGTESCGS